MPSFLQSTQATQASNSGTTFTATDTTVAKNVVPSQNGPFHIFDFLLSSDDTAARVIDFYMRLASVNYLVGSVNIPAGSGIAGVAPVSYAVSVLPASVVGLDVQGAGSIQAAMETTITAAKTVTVIALVGDY